MMDMFDHLNERMRLIGHAFNNEIHKLYGWEGYDWHEKLYCSKYEGDLSEIEFGRGGRDGGDYKRVILATNCLPIDIADRQVVEIPTGEVKIIDHITANANNYDGVVPVPIHYDGSFRKLRGSKKAFSFGFTQVVETELKWVSGGEAALNKFETSLKIGLESRQDWSHEDFNEDEDTRSAGFSPQGPPGYDLQFILRRSSQPKKLKITGLAQIDHGVRIGKRNKNGHWKKKDGAKGRRYDRTAEYDSFYEELLPVLKGEGPRNLEHADRFRKNPAPDWLIRRLERPLQIPFELTTPEFDGATTLDQEQKVIRGPKPGSEGTA